MRLVTSYRKSIERQKQNECQHNETVVVFKHSNENIDLSADSLKEKVNLIWLIRDRWGWKSVAEREKADGGRDKYNLVAGIEEHKTPRLFLAKKGGNACAHIPMSVAVVKR